MSGSSTPRGGATPPPGTSDSPSPLIVGTRFVRQYYMVLSTTPDQIFRFYQPTSYLSHGVGSQPTEPAVFDQENVAQLKDRFYAAQEGGETGSQLAFEFENGAIDAQLSVNGGVLLVVTGHLVYINPDGEEDEDVSRGRRKAFVHTFFLGSMTAGNKRSYYVHNDVLRFLHEDDEGQTVVASNTTTAEVVEETATEEVAAAEPEPKVEEPEPVEEPKVEEPEPEPAPAEPEEEVQPEVLEEAPGGGVEEWKDGYPDEKPAATSAPVEVETDNGEDSSKTSKPVVGSSWASMVARSAGGSSAPSTPSRPSSKPATTTNKPKSSPAPAPAPTPAPAPSTESTPTPRPNPRNIAKRDPDCTLVIKNITEGFTEDDIMPLFEPFATKTDSKIIGATVSAHKGIAFIDYNAPEPVLAAVEQHQRSPYEVKGRVLDIYQKTLERGGRPGGGRGRGFSRGGPNNGNTYRAGGRHPRRGGRGDRGGGKGGRGGR